VLREQSVRTGHNVVMYLDDLAHITVRTQRRPLLGAEEGPSANKKKVLG
jgi:hypothetical protein